MKMRARFLGTALGAAAALLLASAGAAAQPTRAGEKVEASVPSEAKRETIDVQAFVPSPKVLGDAWFKALTAALEAMRRAAELERLAATSTLVPPAPRPRPAAWPSPPASIDARAEPSPSVQARPVPFVPPIRAASDVRGEQAILLGAVVKLPWMVP
jgi:hypothetical protein